jgi:rhamnogalacturonyl hydrolase YesR
MEAGLMRSMLLIAAVAVGLVSGRAYAEEAASGADPYSPGALAAVMHRVNDYQKTHPWKPSDRNWIRGTYYTGVTAFYRATGDEKILAQAMAWANEHQWQPGNERSGGNILTCGQTYCELYFLKKDPAMIRPLIDWVNSGKPNTPTGDKVWYLEGGRRYADSLYVGPPTLAMLAKATGDKKYLDYMHAFYWDVADEIFDREAGLFYRDKRFIGQTTERGKKIFWSRGNGWVLAGLPRILTYLPPDDPQRGRYPDLFKTMAAAVAKVQGEDGLWRANLADPEQAPGPETSGSAFFAYALAWGIGEGLLDKETYLPVVKKAWKGLLGCVREDGRLGFVQPVGDQPAPAAADSTHEYATGAFLLAGSEMLRLAGAVPATRSAAPAAGEGGKAPAVAAPSPATPDAAAALLPAPARAAGEGGAAAHPWAEKINAFLSRQAEVRDFVPTGLVRADYLKVIADQVKTARTWQDASGRIIDPVRKKECYFSTPCYTHAVAVLAAGGYSTDPGLLASGMKAMDAATAGMIGGRSLDHADFYTYPVMMALALYGKVAPADRVAEWRSRLAAVNPKKLYQAYSRGNNWNVVNLSGEYLRAAAGFTNLDYVESRLGVQRGAFTNLGMYDESGDPLPYDHFARHYLAGVLYQGYRGPSFEAYRDLLWRGAWTSLFMQSPFGELPTGYRSSHHIWNEAESAVTYELYAAAYARAGRAAEAGAFKRAAGLSLECVRWWIRPDGTGYVVKNRYPTEAQHAYETYTSHACYNMLVCSMLAQAWQFADESVKESPAPADVGGYVAPVLDRFHKIFAAAGGSYVEYDTCGDHTYNPTGLLRVHLKGGHPQLGPSDGCAPYYSGKGVNVATGPAWQEAAGTWRTLAEATPSAPQFEILSETPRKASFRVTYSKVGPSSATVIETVTVEPDGVTLEDEVRGDGICAMRVTWPMLVFDGLEKTQVEMQGHTAAVSLDGRGVRLTVLEPATAVLRRTGRVLNHRNGQVEEVVAEFQGTRAVIRLTAK